MHTFFTSVRTFATTHKKTSIAIAIAIVGVGYFTYSKLTSTAGQTTYVLGTAERATIVASITGSGQVSAGRQLDLKPQASGTVIYVPVQAGQTVRAGDLIAELDATTAQKSVRDAEANLESANLSLQKLQLPADDLSLLQSENALTQATADLEKAYSDGYAAVSNAFIDLPSVITGLDSTLHATDASTDGSGTQNVSLYLYNAKLNESEANMGKAQTLKDAAELTYAAARDAYEKNFTDYRNTSRSSDTSSIENILNETYQTAELTADAVKSSINLIQYYQDTLTANGKTPIAKSTTHLSTLSGYTTKATGDVSSLLSAKTAVINGKTSVPEKEAALKQLKDGANTLDVQSSELGIKKAQNALEDAKDNLDNYFVRAPFAGTIAKLDVQKGDPASSGTAVATLIASDQVVDIPLNEVDVSKVKVGDKATLTFDAIDSLTLTGKVVSIDTVGTVTQGVVNYTVTIAFDSTDPRVKPGMSTTASIITDVHPDVITVSSSAVKSSAGGSYVLAFTPALDTAVVTGAGAAGVPSATPPEQIPVTIGISDDTNTEIDSGLAEGQQIVVRSIVASTAATAAPSATSLLGGGAARGGAGGGGALRGVAR